MMLTKFRICLIKTTIKKNVEGNVFICICCQYHQKFSWGRHALLLVWQWIQFWSLHLAFLTFHYHITLYCFRALLAEACFWQDIFFLLEQYMQTNHCQHHHQPADADQLVNLKLPGFADWTSVGKTSGEKIVIRIIV